MASLRNKLITSLAAVCAAAGLPNAVVEANVAELLRSAQASAQELTRCPATAEDLASGAALRLLERPVDHDRPQPLSSIPVELKLAERQHNVITGRDDFMDYHGISARANLSACRQGAN